MVPVPTSSWKPGDPARLALLIGTVAGEQTGPAECSIWVERESGQIVAVVWPAGFCARLNPLELLDSTGAVVAVPGTAIHVTGGFKPTDPADPRILGRPEAFHVMDELPPIG